MSTTEKGGKVKGKSMEMRYISFHMTAAKINAKHQHQPISDVWQVC